MKENLFKSVFLVLSISPSVILSGENMRKSIKVPRLVRCKDYWIPPLKKWNV